MSVPAAVRPRFEALMREPLGDTVQLRKDVTAFYADLRAGIDAERLDLDRRVVDLLADTLEALLKRISRKTTPLHHRLVHATAQLCAEGPEQGRALTPERLLVDVALVNETARVVRRPELSIVLPGG